MVQWGRITEHDALNKLIDIITKRSKSLEWVTPEDIYDPLRKFVKSKNPHMKDREVNLIASNIRGWLGSRYTMLSKTSTDYVNIKKLLSFIKDFEQKGKPYNYRRRRPESIENSLNSIAESFLDIEHKLKELETKELSRSRDKRLKQLEKTLYDRVSDAHGKLGELWKLTNTPSSGTKKK